jgi:P2-related tail formation protein
VSFTDEYQTALAPWMNPSLEIYSAAIGGMFEEVWSLVQDRGSDGDPDYVPGWGVLFDVDLCPTAYLPYLAQFVGVVVPTGADDATTRALIRAEAGTQRGTVASIRSAVQRNLTGTQSCFINERVRLDGTPDAYAFVIVVRPSEVTSVAAITAAVDLVKPAGLVYWLVQSDSWTWASATHTWSADTMTWDQTASIQP